MKPIFLLSFLFFAFMASPLNAQEKQRNTIDLNGEWLFEQTREAFPPEKFTRVCPVPGLIHLARPKIDDYDKFFHKPERSLSEESHDLTELDYEPRYSWYKRSVHIPASQKGKEVVITIKKSQYVTQVYINGHDAGQSMACYTPIDLNITGSINFGADNEIMIRVGDRSWLPSQAAGGTDKEKVHYLPGIWDDVSLSFTGKLRLHRTLVLPSLKDKKITVKALVRSFYPAQILYGDPMFDSCKVNIRITDPETGVYLAEKEIEGYVKRDNLTSLEAELTFDEAVPWTPDNPKLYQALISINNGSEVHDQVKSFVGIRDFERRGKFFYLNGRKTYLRGTNITLQRFFEDPDLSDLVWDREWVKKLLIDIPKDLHWNAMRICVGIVPDFWYDIADEYGMMFQNEWLYWQNHGWDEQIRKEYTDWVWSDGDHPSIVIWDAMNENWDPYIGNELIPSLKLLDPTRIWDAGYMTAADMVFDEMDEIHPYRAGWAAMVADDIDQYFNENPYYLGDLDDWPENMQPFLDAGNVQLVNEYGWIWLWRDGQPAKLTKRMYDHLLGEDATAGERRQMMAYWLQLETEWLRSDRSFAGVLAFCYLTNNYGFTGDWFINDIKDLETGPTIGWFRHAFAPSAVFIDLPDQRYLNTVPPYQPANDLVFNLVGINDRDDIVSGEIELKIIDENGSAEFLFSREAVLPPYGKSYIPVSVKLPEKEGGYLMAAVFKVSGQEPVISRRYIRVGRAGDPTGFYTLDPE